MYPYIDIHYVYSHYIEFEGRKPLEINIFIFLFLHRLRSADTKDTFLIAKHPYDHLLEYSDL